MPENGFIVLPRKAFKYDPLWEEKRAFSKWEAWQDLIQRAQYKDGKELTGWNNIKLQRGQVLTSILALSKAWGRSRNWVRLLLKSLSDWDRIRTSKGQSFIIITICNYDKYQSLDSYIGHQKDTKRTLTGHQKDINGTHTKQERQEEKKERDTDSSRSDTSDDHPLSNPFDDLLKHWNGTLPKDDKLRVCAPVAIYSSTARITIKNLFDVGITLDDMKQAATNLQDSVNRGATWPDSPMRIGVFFRDAYQSYMPDAYKKPKEKMDVQKYPDFKPESYETSEEDRKEGLEIANKFMKEKGWR